MTDWIDPKEFKRLWSSLIKAGWRARPPAGLSSDHTHVKPGVKGKLCKDTVNIEYFVGTNALWEYAKQEGLIPPPPPPPHRSGSIRAKKSPIGKLAAYAVVQRRQPEPPAPEQGARVHTASVAATEQGTRVNTASVAATEQGMPVNAASPAATEQDAGVGAALRQRTTVDRNTGDGEANAEEEMKTEDEPTLDAFDRDDFMEAFRAENLFGPVDIDDVNISDESFPCSVESDEESAFDEQESDEEEYVDEVESDPEFEDTSQGFRQDDRAMRELASSGWILYGEDHCADLKLDGAALCDGRWGTTKSAAAFAESPIGMFFYFLPKCLWKRIALESEVYRRRCIPAIAQQTRERQLAAQANDPKKSVRDLEDIINKLERQKPIREHEILHVAGILVARILCGHTDGLSKHWAVSEDGAVPRDTFGRYMKRERFRTITRFLHFTSPNSGDTTTDKAYQIRPILQVIEKGFYFVGTQRSDRLGWPKQLMFKQKKRPHYMPRGT
ncbi:hypothetical protein PPTG_18527 [Phytophthora nicotianae INRA-310]|uniref:PiggyBac transposable element-derived protein domain-containing protein n=1 Tax=Phytophthora nicotianae (strain INRA-310) TaxID=761204 RepID=W2PI85_PHYN3|nr:hypothetical protein PPTG_18527 [Phytophthora nicotianae INRA-310]ETM99938.1 hypothetical protein PPTG_18527 [Phytophthora nicotianae INRA-310]